MASLIYTTAGSRVLSSNSIPSCETANVREAFSFEKRVFSSNRSMRGMKVVTNVTTRPPVSTPRTESDNHESKLVAWESVQQEKWEGELEVEGEIPQWLNQTRSYSESSSLNMIQYSQVMCKHKVHNLDFVMKGTYIRNGPGLWHIEGHTFRHLFDGYATLIRLEFKDGQAIGGHRQIESDAYKAAMKNKKLCYREFSEDPKPENFLSYVGELASLFSGASLTDNANAGVIQLGDGRVLCVTETIKGSIVVDPKTLKTLEKFEYTDALGGILQAAHPIVINSDLVTLLPDLIKPGYLVVRMEAGTNERKVLGRVDCRGGPQPGWVHSFPVTENYIIVPEMPLRYCAQNLLKVEPTPLYKFQWVPENKGYMHVMCKSSGKIVASVEVPLFVTFHYINAYEVKDEEGRLTDIIVDCCEHNADTTILDTLRLQNLRSYGGVDVLPNARVGRFTIPMDGSPMGTLESATDPNQHGRGMDTATMNAAYLGKKYRYAYGCGAKRPTNFPNMLSRVDLVEKTTKTWHDEGSVPSEPFFVARPGATEEDDGVVISMISDRHGEGYALLLDGSTFKEIARAKFPYGLPYGLHACWIPNN